MSEGTPRPRAHLHHDPRVLEADFLAALRGRLEPARRSIPRIAVVAPTRRLLDRLAEVATHELGALAGVRFLVHRRLASELLQDADEPLRAPLASPYLVALTRARVAGSTTRLARYLREQPSALAPLLATVRDLRDAGVTAEAGRRAPLSPRGRETLELFAHFEALLRELADVGLEDAASASLRACEVVARRAPPFDALLHYGAYDLVGVRRDLVAALARRVPTELFVPSVAGHALPRRLLDALGAIVVDADVRTAAAKPGDAPITSAAGPREELRLAVRRLASWHADDQVPWHEMALLVRSPGAYEEALAAECALHGGDAPLLPDTSFTRPLGVWPQARELAVAEANGVAARLARFGLSVDDELVASLLAQPLAFAQRLDANDADEDGAPVRAGTLRVLDFQQARVLPLRRAVVIGVNERLLPRRGVEDFFLPDADRRALADATGRPLPLKRDASVRDEESLLLELVRLGVSERLEVSFARATDERDEAPSPWLARLTTRPLDAALVVPRRPTREIALLHETTRLLPRGEALVAAADVSRESAAVLARRLGWDAVEPGLAMVAATDDYGRASRHDLRFDGFVGELGARDAWSPSQLEQLGRCPLRYFLRHELGVRPRDEPLPSGELDAATLGTLVHDVLRDLYVELLPKDRPLVPDALARARVAVPRLVDAKLAEAATKQKLASSLRAVRGATVTRQVLAFVELDLARVAKLGLRGGEYEFVPKNASVATADGPLRLEMRLDRVLQDGDGREWIGDYKSGSSARTFQSTTKSDLVFRGEELQLPVYAASRAASGAKVGALELLSLAPDRDAAKRFVAFDLAELAAGRARLEETLARLARLRAAGLFPLHPDDEAHGRCGSCDFRLACRHAHGATRARTRAAAEFADYFELAEPPS
jgi:RecB family exonuclease